MIAEEPETSGDVTVGDTVVYDVRKTLASAPGARVEPWTKRIEESKAQAATAWIDTRIALPDRSGD